VTDATGTTEEEWAVWRTFLASYAQLVTEIDVRLRARHGIGQAEYATLASIVESPDGCLRVGQIATALGWERSRTSHLIRRMTERGLVERDERSVDGRASDIIATRLGRKTFFAAVRDHTADVRDLFLDRMTSEEGAVMEEVLSRVTSHLAGSPSRRPSALLPGASETNP
jgi:DNA-binding MarR family transcriptional regulator